MSVEFFYCHDGFARTDTAVRMQRLPGGEWHIVAEAPLVGARIAFVRDATADDLFNLAIWSDAVRRDGGSPSAIIPYLPGARQDRRRAGEALSAKVYADFINACGLARVVCLDPHSDVMPALLDRCTVVPVTRVVPVKLLGGFDGVIAPDAGARRRAAEVAHLLGLTVFQANKQRDPATGALSRFTCESLPPGRMLVVDDICDGGGTFRGLAAVLDKRPEELGLWVTHGVFSGEAARLAEVYGAIYTTDSRTAQQPVTATVVPVVDALVAHLVDILFASLSL